MMIPITLESMKTDMDIAYLVENGQITGGVRIRFPYGDEYVIVVLDNNSRLALIDQLQKAGPF
jgi:hypothetical protein